MKYTVYDRLFKREVGHERRTYTDIRGLYSDKHWVNDLDIVNELEGHNGCVNALSWSRSGRLLASGSDDHRINIHSYDPGSDTEQFSLTTSIVTGHRSNIFSVKFMPYSNDRTIVSCTDDVRIFDIEHSGHSAYGSGSRRRRGGTRPSIHHLRNAVTLTGAETNERAFRSHNDTVKRIVTEDNPFYFLTCSNDGDVRQWDVRQPSKTYPPAQDGRLPSWARDPDAANDVPPPLISYSRYGLDLNTVSCSPSQPHYIALGGAHLHCFLHDRRMLGRDKNRERGSRLSSPSNWTDTDEELLGKATQCVKKFAPSGKQRMKRNDGGHITACKISDAHPNELIVSWSQDNIYSFDLLRTPDVREGIVTSKVATGDTAGRVKDKDRKRKRPKLSTQESTERTGSRQRTGSADEDLALRVRYGNGQSEDIRIGAPTSNGMSQEELNELRGTDHFRIARTTIKVKKRIFDLAEYGEDGLHLAYTSLLGMAHSILSDIDSISSSWGYPMDPDPVDVAVQNKLRDDRAASRRFVQAAGTLSRAMGGQLLTGSSSTSDAMIAQYYTSIQHAPRERELQQHEQFGYDFLKAILLWLDSGPGAVIEGFSSRSGGDRMPIPQDSDMDALEEVLIPYLLDLASEDPIVNVDVSKFMTDDIRVLFPTEIDAVRAFARTIQIPFGDLTGGEEEATQSRNAAKLRWGHQIGRGILLNAASNIKFSFVDRAFGGRGISDATIRAEERALREQQEDIDPVEDEIEQLSAEIARADAISELEAATSGSGSSSNINAEQVSIGVEDLLDEEEEASEESTEEEDDDEEEDSDGDMEDDDDEEAESDSEDEEGLRRTQSGRMLWRSDFGRRRYQRANVERDILCVPHMRVYTGHCNVKTVKDVNFFGLQDEYVVSGSDCGNVFVWDRKTAQLVNILEGDGEVVNVVQGHPYEPTLAVSGIDHTIKIFSPDIRDQHNARKGVGVHSADTTGFSSINIGRRRRPSRPEPVVEPTEDEALSVSDGEVAAGGLRSRKRMHQAYQITSKNDMDSKGGRDDYFISQAVFAQLARHVAAAQGGEGELGEGGEGPIVISEDNCNVM
ncbi:WD and tetratricopeptide repeat-containing protein [Boeremia exigua]|uniref:WD and tetratricopeptide repeat-containing protein n=1 Tax=Boeremia exigua TaxID=749465 RepID=UPI001E8D3974|nr:WD and tetratricopeptide repeat-containing protein [Boeremia exigua]KAH6620124.1 WD and tetratricopeptide repeat-containing protein [Boeremia exigua]